MGDDKGAEFSKLEAGFASLKIPRRRVSMQAQEPWRHANEQDLVTDDLDFNYDVDAARLPRNPYPSMQGILPALQYGSHLANPNNFADETSVQCFEQTDDLVVFHTLDSAGLDKVLDTVKAKDADTGACDTPSMPNQSSSTTEARTLSSASTQLPSPAVTPHCPSSASASSAPQMGSLGADATSETTLVHSTTEAPAHGRLLVFFVPLEVRKDSAFGSRASIQGSSVQRLFDLLGVNPEFLLNLLGRPDYWSPQTRWQYDMEDELTLCDYYCQYPRWNLQVQGAPLSVYVMRRVKTNLTAYIISHKMGDSTVHALQQILKAGVSKFNMGSNPSAYLANPFEIAVLLSSLSFEASKYHMSRFRRYMWEQVNKVDDHLAGLETSDRGRLTELTKSLQIIAQQADSHLLNANVAIITAKGIRDTQARLHDLLSTRRLFRHPAEDAINYVIDSMEKQKMLFENYKSRKNGTMSLVYNLVTQSDASNNIEVARSMKRDSTSMSAIAVFTEYFYLVLHL